MGSDIEKWLKEDGEKVALLSVYPEHMELEEIKREIEEENFWISSGSTEAPERDFEYLEGVNG